MNQTETIKRLEAEVESLKTQVAWLLEAVRCHQHQYKVTESDAFSHSSYIEATVETIYLPDEPRPHGTR